MPFTEKSLLRTLHPLGAVIGVMMMLEHPNTHADTANSADAARLEARVRQLEIQVQQLQQSCAANVAVSKSPSLERGADELEHWGLHLGDTQLMVQKALGNPDRSFSIGNKMVWYYRTRHGSGSVFFNPDGTLSSFQLPPEH